jgi:hypothetical protein
MNDKDLPTLLSELESCATSLATVENPERLVMWRTSYQMTRGEILARFARARREGAQESQARGHKALAACLIALLKRQGETRLHLTGDEVEAAYKHLDTERSFELTWNRVTDDVFFEFFPLPTEAQA